MNAYGTKVSKSRMGSPRFAGSDEPANSEPIPFKLTPEEMEHYLKTHELPKHAQDTLNKNKKKRGRQPKMKPEQAQELEKKVVKEVIEEVNRNDLREELKKLEEELTEASQNNVKLQNLLDDLQEKYNKLALDYDKSQEIQYDLTRAEGQRDQLRASLKETEEELVKESNKRWILETALKLYLP